jgi:hypothetical protein
LILRSFCFIRWLRVQIAHIILLIDNYFSSIGENEFMICLVFSVGHNGRR